MRAVARVLTSSPVGAITARTTHAGVSAGGAGFVRALAAASHRGVISHHRRPLHSQAAAATADATPAVAASGGCGSSGCACATAAASSSSGVAPATGGGCGAGCACAAKSAESEAAAAEALAESQRMQAELAALQRTVSSLHSLGQYEDALTTAGEARDLAFRLFGDEHPAYASTLNNLALLHRVHRQEYAEAAKLYEQALGIYRAVVGEQHASTLTCLNNLGLTYRSLGDLARAHSTLSQVLQSHESALSPAAQKTSLPLAQAQMNLAGVLRERNSSADGDLPRALALFQSSLLIVQRKYGDEHPLTATVLNNLAFTHKCAGAFSDALPLYQRALGIRSRNLPPKHPDLIISLNNLAECLRGMGQEDKAVLVQQKMVEIMNAHEEQEQQEQTTATQQPAAN